MAFYSAVPFFLELEAWMVSKGLASPRGLLTGLLAVLVLQVVTFAYYFVVRVIVKPPTIRKKDPPESTLLTDLWGHIAAPESFAMVFSYLVGTWIFWLMPASYYDIESPVNWLHVALQFLCVDFWTFVDHLIEHNWPALYRRSHKSHHKFNNPKLYNAFNGSVPDTLSLILIPLFITLQTCRFATCWSFVAFGALYATQFTLIHCEFAHPWEYAFRYLGIGTAWDHNVHHSLVKYNYGHFFMYWDFLWGSYRDPWTVPNIAGVPDKKGKTD
eukprot:TRINITY_DN2450_c0_g1_i2.p1 TRINITY_DN2450_c0_g1~~TRINITY_DN2450_c0_g1_i2.p1  ORF type:complete len:307 (+),score=30.79 TRINITY_DN2450_c0_g1_i2:109-921(+)